MYGSLEHGRDVIQAHLERERRRSASWIPDKIPNPPSLPLPYWTTNVDLVRHEAKAIFDHFNTEKQGLGVGHAPPYWTKKTLVSKLHIGQNILLRLGFRERRISPECLASWEDLKGHTFAKGPKKEDKCWMEGLVHSHL